MMDRSQLDYFMDAKIAEIANRAMDSSFVTQFSFDPQALLSWLSGLRNRGIANPVRLGGGPDWLMAELEAGLNNEHSPCNLHFYPFGRRTATVDWIDRNSFNELELKGMLV